jgi:hypothetical protein
MEAIEAATVLLQVAARISKSLRSTQERAADGNSLDDSHDRSRAIAAVAIVVRKLNNLREILTTIRDDRPVQSQVVDSTLKALGEVDESLNALALQLDRVQIAIAESRTRVAETRTSVRRWSSWIAAAGSVFLAWMGLGQITLLRRSWSLTRASSARAPDAAAVV